MKLKNKNDTEYILLGREQIISSDALGP
jgi:hypothetical protein